MGIGGRQRGRPGGGRGDDDRGRRGQDQTDREHADRLPHQPQLAPGQFLGAGVQQRRQDDEADDLRTDPDLRSARLVPRIGSSAPIDRASNRSRVRRAPPSVDAEHTAPKAKGRPSKRAAQVDAAEVRPDYAPDTPSNLALPRSALMRRPGIWSRLAGHQKITATGWRRSTVSTGIWRGSWCPNIRCMTTASLKSSAMRSRDRT